MAENQIDSWLLSNPDHNDQVDHRSLNLGSYGSCGANDQCQCQCQFNPMQAQGFQTSSSYLSMVPGIVSDATIGTMDLPREWTLNQLPFSPFYPGNEVKEEIGTFTNSTSSYISSLGIMTQQQVSQDYLQKPSNPPPMSRQDRLQRYFDKKKTRKYETKVIYSSRKTYAQTRPRIRGRFARSSQTDASEK
ncbi:hypothetical protein QVD17_39013 [Tagetes erecta]|uniref:CCT domain-containing protein n=1 Tax=Tagetes erecta TaxID=13708 RepID=A0AAD8JRJ6_TARER|nr:hypothetical protein QVD17_39013 [Tagetes erecta]